MSFENIFCHSYEYTGKKESFLKLLNESVDVCCPQNEIRLLNKKNHILVIKNVTKEFQKKTLEHFYMRYSEKKSKTRSDLIVWKENEVKYLKRNYKECFKKLSKILNKSEYQIGYMIGKLKLYEKKKWNDIDDRYLKDNYLRKTDLEIAAELKRSLASIKSRRGKLGLIIAKI